MTDTTHRSALERRVLNEITRAQDRLFQSLGILLDHDDTKVLETLRKLGETDLADAYEVWAEDDLREPNEATAPAPDPADSSSYALLGKQLGHADMSRRDTGTYINTLAGLEGAPAGTQVGTEAYLLERTASGLWDVWQEGKDTGRSCGPHSIVLPVKVLRWGGA